MSRVAMLTSASRSGVPDCCADCVFWQSLRTTSDRDRKERWAEGMQRRFGPWGRVLWEGDRFLGLLQYGPSGVFPRAQILPAGPPDRAAALLTCVYLAGDDPAGVCERLVLEALADLQARRLAAAEAFALRHPDDVPSVERFLGHHTLFDLAFLTRLGFAPVRLRGQVGLLRLELGGLQRSPAAHRARRALGRLRPAPPDPAPRPA
jgi:hypothetical protein